MSPAKSPAVLKFPGRSRSGSRARDWTPQLRLILVDGEEQIGNAEADPLDVYKIASKAVCWAISRRRRIASVGIALLILGAMGINVLGPALRFGNREVIE